MPNDRFNLPFGQNGRESVDRDESKMTNMYVGPLRCPIRRL